MNSILFIYIFSLFVVTSPNFIFKIPIKNHLVVAIIHAVIFSCILYFTYDIVNRDVLESAIVNNGTKQDDGTVHTIDDGTTIVVNNSDKSSELNEIQKNAVNIAELEEQHNQSMLDAAINAAELAKSYAANAEASSASVIRAANQYNSAATASNISPPTHTAAEKAATAAEKAAAEKAAAEKAAAEKAAAEKAAAEKAAAAAEKAAAEKEAAEKAAAEAAAKAAAEAAAAKLTASIQAAATQGYTNIGRQNFGSYGAVVTGGQYIIDSSYPDSEFCLVLETNGSLRLIRGISPTGPTIWSYESGRSPGNSQAKWEGHAGDEEDGAFTIRYNGSAIWSIPGSNVGMGKGLILQNGQVTLRTVDNELVWQNP